MPRPTRFFGLRLWTPLVDSACRSIRVAHSPQPGHFLAGPQLQQAVDGGLDQVDRVGAAVHLGQDVGMPAASSTSRTPGPALTPVPGPAGTRTTRLAPNLPTTRCGIVSPRERDLLLPLERLLGVLGGLLDGGRHFVGLAVAPGDPARAVADDDQGVEAEAPAALDDGGAAADLHDESTSALSRESVSPLSRRSRAMFDPRIDSGRRESLRIRWCLLDCDARHSLRLRLLALVASSAPSPLACPRPWACLRPCGLPSPSFALGRRRAWRRPSLAFVASRPVQTSPASVAASASALTRPWNR